MIEARAASNAILMAKATNEALGTLETEERMAERVKKQVASMVDDQLRASGFDPDLTLGTPQVVRPVSSAVSLTSDLGERASYASILSEKSVATQLRAAPTITLDRREERFWECRRSLRFWPIKDGTRESLEEFLEEKLEVDEAFIRDLGEIKIVKLGRVKAAMDDEVIATFACKEIRDTIKAQTHRLAQHKEAGMRIHLLSYLQKDFKILMRLAFIIKQKNPDLRRNVKFDEDELSLFMDMQMKKDGPWRRVK